ncbi:MAG TPA: hypothetical protein VG367_06875 [Mucilaginibacter sp.]|nr:hypothetical protein [Mucilaginibacter sp.]
MYLIISIFLLTIAFVVIAMAYISARNSLQAHCDHYWEDRGDGEIKCSKCDKKFKSA